MMQHISGEKPLAGQIVGIVVNIGIDIWWWINNGFDVVFWIFLGVTVFQVVQAIVTLRKSIHVADSGVTVNGTTIPYNMLADVSARKRRITVNTTDGKRYHVPINNAQAVNDAIWANRAVANGA